MSLSDLNNLCKNYSFYDSISNDLFFHVYNIVHSDLNNTLVYHPFPKIWRRRFLEKRTKGDLDYEFPYYDSLGNYQGTRLYNKCTFFDTPVEGIFTPSSKNLIFGSIPSCIIYHKNVKCDDLFSFYNYIKQDFIVGPRKVFHSEDKRFFLPNGNVCDIGKPQEHLVSFSASSLNVLNKISSDINFQFFNKNRVYLNPFMYTRCENEFFKKVDKNNLKELLDYYEFVTLKSISVDVKETYLTNILFAITECYKTHDSQKRFFLNEKYTNYLYLYSKENYLNNLKLASEYNLTKRVPTKRTNFLIKLNRLVKLK